MQMGFGRGITDTVKKLLIANVIVFFLQMIGRGQLVSVFGLVPYWTWSRFYIWQFVTYMFLHGGFWHIMINMYMLWMFGCELERMWGSKAFLKYYFITGIGAGLFYTLLSATSTIPTIGASGAIYGIMTAYALMFPERKIMWIFPPIIMNVRTMVLIWIGISVVSGVFGSADGIAHFAHLGGALVGYLYVKQDWRLNAWIEQIRQWNRRRRMRVYREKKEDIDELRRIIDSILDKANEVGMENLTREEQQLLKRASKIIRREEKKN